MMKEEMKHKQWKWRKRKKKIKSQRWNKADALKKEAGYKDMVKHIKRESLALASMARNDPPACKQNGEQHGAHNAR